MNRFDWLSGFLAELQDEHVLVRRGSARQLHPAHVLQIDAEDWSQSARIAALNGYRWVSIWGNHCGDDIVIYSCLEHLGDYLILQTHCPVKTPLLSSLTPYFPAADRPERHLQDMYGVVFTDHPDHRRWTRHLAWNEQQYPLRRDFPLQGTPEPLTPPDNQYEFDSINGHEVYEIPVGPVHAGIIEPGHFRFNAVGEEILSLEQHLGYLHKGIEKTAVGRNPQQLAKLAARVSGDTTVAHGWAACQAMERAAGCKIPKRAVELRALACERERVINHLGDIGAICNDVGFAFAQIQCGQLQEQWKRRNAELFRHRLMMDYIVPGGVACDLDKAAVEQLKQDHTQLLNQGSYLFDLLLDQPSLEDRLLTTGKLNKEKARQLGCSGYVAKASGLGFDVRNTKNYSPYKTRPVIPVVLSDGDVLARVQIRMQEIIQSLHWMTDLLVTLSGGKINTLFSARANSEGISFIEGWRGEILCHIRFDSDGLISRYFPHDPSWQSWPALQECIHGNIVADFPVCNKSINGSYSGHDL